MNDNGRCGGKEKSMVTKDMTLKQEPLGPVPPGDIRFFLAADKETPMLELKANGDIMVRGKLIENDKELVDGLREWFRLSKIERAASR